MSNEALLYARHLITCNKEGRQSYAKVRDGYSSGNLIFILYSCFSFCLSSLKLIISAEMGLNYVNEQDGSVGLLFLSVWRIVSSLFNPIIHIRQSQPYMSLIILNPSAFLCAVRTFLYYYDIFKKNKVYLGLECNK